MSNTSYSMHKQILLFGVLLASALLTSLIFHAPSAHADVGLPSWWSGKICDTNNYPNSYQLSSGSKYDGVIACGPGPNQGGTDHAVQFTPYTFTNYEWECVELSERFLDLVYGQAPYSAPGGKDIVNNYPGTTLTKVNNNGSSLPSSGDIFSESGTQQNFYGHTGVITSINVTNGTGTVSTIEQNNSSSGVNTISVSNNVLQSNVSGWLHDPNGSSTALTPASISFNGALNVFKIGGDNNLYQNYWNGHTWNGWTNIGGSFVSNPAVIINGNALNIFERGLDGQIYTEYNSGSGWSGWTSLGGHQMKGNPTVMFYGTSMNVFALDTNNVPYEDTQDSSGHWAGWGSNTNIMASDPAAVSYGGKLHLIYRGGDNKPYENVFGSSGWSGFSQIGQNASVSGNPSALSYSAEGELDVYFNTSVNQIWKDTNSGSGWGSWTQIGSSFVSDPEIMAYNNDLQIFARDTSNNIETRYWSYSGQSWSSWTSLGGSSNNLASDPFAYQNGSSELDVYASDGSANAYDNTKIAPNNWGGFSKLN